MSLENSNTKGKAVVKEEVSPLTPLEPKPFPAMSNQDSNKAMPKEEQEEVAPPPTILATAAPHHHHQTPPSSDVLGRSSGVVQGAVATAAQMMQLVAMQWGLAATPAVFPPAFQPLDGGRIRLIKEAMQHCVGALAAGNVVAANAALLLMSTLSSVDGDPLRRVAYAFSEALGRRALQAALPGLYAGLQQLDFPRLGQQSQPQPAVAGAGGAGCAGAARICFDGVSPLLRAAACIANHMIATAMEGEARVHVVDIGGASPNQWVELLHLLALRRGGAPASVRLTVVGEEEPLLAGAAGLLRREAARLGIPFVFNPVRSHIDRLSPADVASFGVDPRRGEALAISSTLQLHRLIADVTRIELPAAADHHQQRGRKRGRSTTTTHEITMADALLRVLCDMSPKLFVLMEQEAWHNGGGGGGLGDRVGRAFDHYAALFGDLEAGGAARESVGRAAVERGLLRDEIMDVVARDGAARRERHEGFLGWARRMGVAGFLPLRLEKVRRFDAFADPALLAQQMSPLHGTLRYWVGQDNTCFIIFANLTPMFSVTAWRPAAAATTGGE